MRALLFDHIGHAVYTLTTGDTPSTVTQGRYCGGLQVTLQARYLSEGWRRNQHRLCALRLKGQLPGDAVTHP
ncbi:hypothetical protein D3C80_2026020 [compost metagenome]